MRNASLLLLTQVMLATGCSHFIARSGEKLQINSQKDAIAKFGPPTKSGIEDGKPFDEFRSRRKFAEEFRAHCNITALCVTLGFAEFYHFPRELYLLAKRGVFGETIRVTYNPDGSVRRKSIDGWWGRDISDAKVKPPDNSPYTEPPPDVLTPTVQKLLDEKK